MAVSSEKTKQALIEHYGERAATVLIRTPAIDPLTPNTADLDVLVPDDVDEYLPHRLIGLPAGSRRVDVIRYPAALMERPGELAVHGLIPHRLLTSDPLCSGHGCPGSLLDALSVAFQDPAARATRLKGFLNLAADTVQETGVTRDFPELAVFWLHMSFAAIVAVLAEDVGLLCPNVYTRPFDFVGRIEDATGLSLHARAVDALALDVDPGALAEPLRRIHDRLEDCLDEPVWPETMRQCTRFEYRYFAARDELEWRIAVADELAANGHPAAAVFYLRFVGYMLACLPIVRARAVEGIDVSYIRPQRAVLPDLATHCPRIIGDLRRVFGSNSKPPLRQLDEAQSFIDSLRNPCVAALASTGVSVADVRPWRPYGHTATAG